MALTIKQSKVNQLFNIILNDKERKPLFKMFWELMQLFIIHRTSPFYYFSRRLYKKNRTNIKDYLPDKLLLSLWKVFNDLGAANVLMNKLYFNFFYGQFNHRLPKILMYNHLNMFVMDHRQIEIMTVHDFGSVLENLIEDQSVSKSIFIKKTYGSYGGYSTYRISADQLPLNQKAMEEMYKDISASGYLFQETIQQHPEMNIINTSSVNTIRFDTFIDRDGKIEIISAYLRMSSNNLHVDNCSSGGCFVGVDLDSGKLKKYGYTTFTKAGGKILTEHPISKIKFENFSIPKFQEAKELVLSVAGHMPSLRLIGWDVGIGIAGPILIEGNCGYDISISDLAYGGYRTNPVFMKVLDEINFH